MSEAEVAAYRIFPNNLPAVLKEGDIEYLGQRGPAWGEEVGKTKVSIQSVPDRLATTELSIDPILGATPRGVFCISAYGDRASSQGQLAVQTDIGLLACWQAGEVVLFAHHLTTLEPLGLLKISLYSDKNQLLAQGNTDAAGLIRLGPFEDRLGQPALVVAEDKDDFSFLKMEPRQDGAEQFKAAEAGYDRTAYDAFLYADRDLYRPGDTVHFRWTVRQNYGEAAAGLPLILSILKPNGRELLSEPIELGTMGTGGKDLTTQTGYPTGKYTARLQIPGSKRVIGQYPFSIEEFVPNRMEAKIAVQADRILPGAPIAIEVAGKHYTGAAAADRKCEAQIIVGMGEVLIPGCDGYHFGNDAEPGERAISLGDTRSDEQGRATFDFTYTPQPEDTAPRKAVVSGRIYELGGRAVYAAAERPLFPSGICLGLSAEFDESTGELVTQVAAVNPDGSPAAADSVTVTLEQRRWSYYLRRYYSNNEPRWSESFEEVRSTEAPLAEGRALVRLPMPRYGYFRIRVSQKDTPQYSTLTFYSYGRGCQRISSDRPNLVKVLLDKPAYLPGGEAEVRIESAFDGLCLVAIQGEQFRDVSTVRIENGEARHRVRVEAGMFPNVWVEATVIHAIGEEGAPAYPYTSFGAAPLRVDDPARRLSATIQDAPETIRPGRRLEFNVSVQDGTGAPASAEVTVAAVDEGIHALTGYENPDPYAWLGRLRRPSLLRAHYYDRVAYDFEKPEPGGGAAQMALRLAGPDQTWIKTVALWSGVVHTDEQGRAAIALDVPEFAGRLRLVAVACDAHAAGAASTSVTVKRDYELRTSMPRFLLPDDKADCRAVLFNHTNTPCTAHIRWNMEGALQAVPGEATLELAANAEGHVSAAVAAGVESGQGTITWEAEFLSGDGVLLERIEDRAPLPVRPPAAFQSSNTLAVLHPGEQREFHNTEFIEDGRAQTDIGVERYARPRTLRSPALRGALSVWLRRTDHLQAPSALHPGQEYRLARRVPERDRPHRTPGPGGHRPPLLHANHRWRPGYLARRGAKLSLRLDIRPPFLDPDQRRSRL